MHSIDWALQQRGQQMVDVLMAYEAHHPRQGPDAAGQPYDPVRDVIMPWLASPAPGVRPAIDEARTTTIKSRTWEGFAWANHRFVVSDERGNALIVGFNEDVGKWFVDTTTPVELTPEWVSTFIAGLDPEGRATGYGTPREVHAEIVRLAGGGQPTIPSMDEVAHYLTARHAQ
jgi:hypothetical protein